MTLSKSTYDKINADPKRSTIAKQGAYKRMTNEKRIVSLQAQLLQMEVQRDDLLAALEALLAAANQYQDLRDRNGAAIFNAHAAIAKARGES